MGAIIRTYERKIEQQIDAEKTRGVRTSHEPVETAVRWERGKDVRESIPRLGLREYWYPAMPARKVRSKPLYWVMLGDEMVFFRDKQGQAVALWDFCPHRGASLSDPDNWHFPGFISCPYHGATYDGQGECVAFLTEGPDSKMVGRLRAKVYPTRTLKDWVFVWMGEGDPAPIEEDVPPEFFDDDVGLFASYTYWETNWLLAIENHSDAHNCFYVHRNCWNVLLFGGGRNRSPIGPRSEIINGGLRAIYDNQDYYADENGKLPYQMYYPGVDGYWPKHRWRQLWQPIVQKLFRSGGGRKHRGSAEWQVGHHLPSLVRTGGGNTRYAVPVKANLSRIVHFYFPPRGRPLANLWNWLYYALIYNPLHYEFSAADDGAASQCRFWAPEHLSATDSQVVVMRRMVVERSRDAQRGTQKASDLLATGVSITPVGATQASPAGQASLTPTEGGRA